LNTDIEIVEAVPADAPEILALQRLAYQPEAARYNDWTIPPLTQTLAELAAEFGSSRILKAVGAGKLIGSVRAHSEGDTCSIGRLIVHPDHRRLGTGSRLMARIEKLHPSVRRFELFTGSRSAENIRLYRKLGYRPFRESTLPSHITLVHLEKIAG
jgi:ribosomal protein S18 acetylase RimI-like enzyme